MKLNKDSTYVLGGYSYSRQATRKQTVSKATTIFGFIKWMHWAIASGTTFMAERCQITKHLSIKPQTAGLLWVVIQIPLHRSTNQALLKV